MAPRCRAAILISGSGSNLQAFIDAVAEQQLNLELCVVFSNQADAYGLVRAKKAGIETACIQHADFPDRTSFDQAVIGELDKHRPDLLILAGFMRILTDEFVAHYRGKIINIHPALLPHFPGLNTHQRVLDSGHEWHGSTVHFVTEELDAGPRILQGRLKIRDGENAADLQQRVQTIEHKIYTQAAALVASGAVEFRDGCAWSKGAVAQEPQVITF